MLGGAVLDHPRRAPVRVSSDDLPSLIDPFPTQTVFFAFVALFAVATAIPAPQRPKAALQQIEPRPVAAAAAGSLDAADELEAGSEDQDLKGASSYGYGYYGGFPGYGYGYYPGYAYSYGWGREFSGERSVGRMVLTYYYSPLSPHTGYPYYRYGGLYGGYWY